MSCASLTRSAASVPATSWAISTPSTGAISCKVSGVGLRSPLRMREIVDLDTPTLSASHAAVVLVEFVEAGLNALPDRGRSAVLGGVSHRSSMNVRRLTTQATGYPGMLPWQQSRGPRRRELSTGPAPHRGSYRTGRHVEHDLDGGEAGARPTSPTSTAAHEMQSAHGRLT